MGAILAPLLSLKQPEDRERPDPLIYLSERIQKEKEETRKWYITAEVYRRHGKAFAARYSPHGDYDFEKLCEEETERELHQP
jgi:hypothetical protein